MPADHLASVTERAFIEHQEWLQQLHSMHASHVASRSVGIGSSQLSPLPHAPMSWALPQEGNDVPSGAGGSGSIDERFGDIALSDDEFEQPRYRSSSNDEFELPVYRGLGGFLPADEVAASLLDFADERPVYRSIGLAPAPQLSSGEPLSAEDAERAWLESMPPLIRRQNARGPSILVA